MSRILKLIFLWLFLLKYSTIISYGQNNIIIPQSFKETIPPKVWSDAWFKLNNSKNECKVEIVNSKLKIGTAKNIYECKLEIENGILLGTDRGEFGGQLIFIPNDKSNDTIKVTKGNINFLFRFKSKIYFISGLAHMTFNGGGMFEIKREGNHFSFQKVIEFESAPMAFTIYKDKLYLAADKGFYVIKDLKKEIFFKDVFWEGLYPNSIAVANNQNVFVGIRSGIVKLDLTTKKIKFYKKI